MSQTNFRYQVVLSGEHINSNLANSILHSGKFKFFPSLWTWVVFKADKASKANFSLKLL